MIKKILISICLISLLLFLQYGRSEHVVSSYVECYESTENQELVIIANKIIIIDRTQYAQKLLQKILDNKLKNIRLSYDYGIPEKMTVRIYSNRLMYKAHIESYVIEYVN